MSLTRPDIVIHNKETMEAWKLQANEHNSKVFCCIGITPDNMVKFFQVKNSPRHLLITYLRHCADMLEAEK